MFSKAKEYNQIIPAMRGLYATYILDGISFFFLIVLILSPFLPNMLSNYIGENEKIIVWPFLILMFFFAIISEIYTSLAISNHWEKLAIQHSLQYQKNTLSKLPELSGSFQKYHIKIEISPHFSGRLHSYSTNFYIHLHQPIEHTLTIKNDSFLNGSPGTIYDVDLYKKYEIETTSDALIRHILTDRRIRRGLLELGDPKRFNLLNISPYTIHYKESGRITDIDYLSAVLRFLTDLAKTSDNFTQMSS